MRKIKRPKLGDYVIASRWSDLDPNDPWHVGYVVGVLDHVRGMGYYLEGSERQWKHVWRISKEEGAEWLKNFVQQTHAG
jgi:hypothetical protein